MPDKSIGRRALMALAAALLCVPPPRPAIGETRGRRHAPTPRHVVALDPGHGGLDPGAIGPHGLKEKAVTLATARAVARRLAATGRYRPFLTRRSDRYVSLRRRVSRARAEHAELFLSIHANALPDKSLRGLAVYTLSEAASDSDTAKLAARENREDFIAGLHLRRRQHDVAAVLLDMARRRTGNRSLHLAHTVVAELGRLVPLLERPQRSAAFVVLSAPDMPSALVELGCLSNPAEERLLQEPRYRERLAAGLVRAIDAYFTAPAG
ncbi:MAG TPA: N-acetylmuramoyl-L-alanine amidase [Stellaceae bacterium]|nr:N-acetylmuramoyl-L-alanine amidase [Stellaceae bacterium]